VACEFSPHSCNRLCCLPLSWSLMPSPGIICGGGQSSCCSITYCHSRGSQGGQGSHSTKGINW
jgi:hypothetical protein